MERKIILDTTSKYLVVALADEDKVLDSIQYVAWQRQSEYAIQEVENILSRNNLTASDITRIIVTNGPGSYTGIRIALTIAKVWSLASNIPVCVLSSLQAMAGVNGKKISILDARSKRAYVGMYENGIVIQKDQVMTLDEVNDLISNNTDFALVGELKILGLEEENIDYALNMLELSKITSDCNDVDALVPVYLKDAI